MSKATVSRVLTGSANVREAASRRVLDAVERLGYQPNAAARSLATGRSRVIGVLVSDIEIPFFTAIARAIQNVAQRGGYLTMFANSDERPEAEDVLVRELASRMMDGLIVAPAAGTNTALRELAVELPIVLVDRLVDGLALDAVLSDNVGGALAATSHLLELGHRRIAYATETPDKTSTIERLAGLRAAFSARGLEHPPELVWEVDYHPAAAERVLARRLRDERPTALLAAEGSITLGAVRAANGLGLTIPRDLSVLGFDQLDWSSATTPPLTVVSQDAERIGREAANLLLARLAGRRKHVATVSRVPTELMKRSSCASPRACPAERYASTSSTRVSARTPSCSIAAAAPAVCIAAATASMSATSMSTATRVGFCGSTNVRMLVTPSGPKNSSRLVDASQCAVSFTSWCPITVGMALAPLGYGSTA